MRRFKRISDWEYNECTVEEMGTDKFYTLTQPHTIAKEDFYSIKRTVAIPNDFSGDVFEVYEILYMPNGYNLNVVGVDFDTMKQIIRDHVEEFLMGRLQDVFIKEFGS